MRFKASTTTLGASTRTPPGDPSFGRCQQAPRLPRASRIVASRALQRESSRGPFRVVPPCLLIRGWSTVEAQTIILPLRLHCTGMRLVPPPPATLQRKNFLSGGLDLNGSLGCLGYQPREDTHFVRRQTLVLALRDRGQAREQQPLSGPWPAAGSAARNHLAAAGGCCNDRQPCDSARAAGPQGVRRTTSLAFARALEPSNLPMRRYRC